MWILIGVWGLSEGFRLQAAGAEGTVMCGNRPASNVLVKLMDEDDGPDPDDTLVRYSVLFAVFYVEKLIQYKNLRNDLVRVGLTVG